MNPQILIFDDDQEILDLCSIVLTRKGFRVAVRDTCEDLFPTVEQIRPDLILMDNWIPDIGGAKAISLLKNHPVLKHIPVVFFTANSDAEKNAQVIGADGFLSKPFNLKDLEEKVKSLVKNTTRGLDGLSPDQVGSGDGAGLK